MTFWQKFWIGLGGIALLLSLVSFIPTDFWAVRALDLVREPFAFVLLILGLAAIFFGAGSRRLLAALFGASLVIQVWQVWPYWSFAPEEMTLERPGPDATCFTAYSANVLMDNRDFPAMTAQIRRYDPDIVFLTETDQAWVDALVPALSGYPTLRTLPKSDTFGKVFASRVPVVDTDIVERQGEDTPTLFAVLQLDTGDAIEFVGVHPRAPLPGQNTEERDNSILRAAQAAGGGFAGGIAMGDFNDVPWSSTTSRFREDQGWRDPRIGRGTHPTFPSDYLPLGWPLDQIMVKGDVTVSRFDILADNGSDHRAVLGEFCVAARDD
ncbi:endonuclease/exonuclease/phosphatase family protein [Qipengyuania nanhaisediminis]|uniref:endonuclease/exonuclease/phosphatase family protein n=1 Tax=Qipengyuania nanhaisediminis TaxID=604088 RepID=UPI0038B39780